MPLIFRWTLLLCCCLVKLAGAGEQAAYVWQRNWTPALIDAIEQQSPELDGLTVLYAEVNHLHAQAAYRANIDYPTLRASKRPITLALRFNLSSYTSQTIHEAFENSFAPWCRQALATARENGLEPAAIEIDFDCPTSQLDAYAAALRTVRAAIGELPLSITTLPTWMQRPAPFARLVQSSDHFVLQVHSIQRAHSIHDSVQLCDPQQALKWSQQAAQFKVPFHIALPTYAYRLAYDPSGQLVEVASEDASPIQNPDWTYRIVRAEPTELAALVRRLQTELPPHCAGLIWYRLPIGNERHNWDMQTWRAVRHGLATPATSWHVQAIPQADGAIEIEIHQTAPIATTPPTQITVLWPTGTALAWDGQRNYQVATRPDHGLTWQWPTNTPPSLLPQGTRWTIGWLRMDTEVPLQIRVSP